MKFTVVIPYCYGGDELRITAVKNLLDSIDAQYHRDFEVIVVEQLVKVKERSFPFVSRVKEVIVIKDPWDRWFNKSWCINVGVKSVTTDNVLIIDADSLFGREYFSLVLDFAKKHEFFHGYSWIVLLPGRDNPLVRIRPHSDREIYTPDKMYGIYATGGTWFTSTKFYWETLGGMNESYFGYGGEDGDMWSRVNYVFKGQIPELDYPIVHQYHHWHPADGANPLDLEKMRAISAVTAENPELIIQRLKEVQLGDRACPTLIKML